MGNNAPFRGTLLNQTVATARTRRVGRELRWSTDTGVNMQVNLTTRVGRSPRGAKWLVMLVVATVSGCGKGDEPSDAPAAPAPGTTPARAAAATAGIKVDVSAPADPAGAAAPVVRVNGQPVALDKLAAHLQGVRGRQRDARAAIACDPDLPYGALKPVLAAVAAAKVSLARYDARDGSSVACQRTAQDEADPGRDGFGLVCTDMDAGHPMPPNWTPLTGEVIIRLVRAGGQTSAAAGESRETTDLGAGLEAMLAKHRQRLKDGGVKEAELAIAPRKDVPYRDLVRAYAAGRRAGYDRVVIYYTR